MTNDELLVVIQGSGALALALLAERSWQAGIPPVVLCRSQSDSRPISDRLGADLVFDLDHGDSGRETIELSDIIFYDDDTGSKDLQSRLATTPNVLYLTAARAGQRAAAKIIAKAVAARRQAGVPGVFVVAPCENAIAYEMERLAVKLAGPDFAYVDMMVDRISLDVRQRPQDGRIEVLAESNFQWTGELQVPQDQDRIAFRTVFDHFERMRLTLTEDIQQSKKRKTFLMNGVQTCFALLARSDDEPFLRPYHEAHPGMVEKLSMEYAMALTVWANLNKISYTQPYIEFHRRWYHTRVVESLYLSPDGERGSRIIGKYAPLQRQDQLLDIASKIAEAHDLLRRAFGKALSDQTLMYRALQVALELEDEAMQTDFS
jgi:hypothetical protein